MCDSLWPPLLQCSWSLGCSTCVVDGSAGAGLHTVTCFPHFDWLWVSVTVSVSKRSFCVDGGESSPRLWGKDKCLECSCGLCRFSTVAVAESPFRSMILQAPGSFVSSNCQGSYTHEMHSTTWLPNRTRTRKTATDMLTWKREVFPALDKELQARKGCWSWRKRSFLEECSRWLPSTTWLALKSNYHIHTGYIYITNNLYMCTYMYIDSQICSM